MSKNKKALKSIDDLIYLMREHGNTGKLCIYLTKQAFKRTGLWFKRYKGCKIITSPDTPDNSIYCKEIS